MSNETSKANKRRIETFLYNKVFFGDGIDIGCGSGAYQDLLDKNLFKNIKSVLPFDVDDGDAQYVNKYVNNKFDFVYSSQTLEHMYDVEEALKNWWSIVKDDGYLIVTVPDEDLYEQGNFPSKYNWDHKWTFSISKLDSWSPKHINILELITILDNYEIIKIELIDTNYNYEIKDQDQTRGDAEAFIEFILKKKSTKNNISDYESTYTTIDDNDNLSICYSNLYCIDSRLKYLTTKNENLPYVNKWTNSYPWRPDLILFNTDDELINYVKNLNLKYIKLATYGDMLHAHNIGHGLLDCLYPPYLSLIKFNYINDDFSFIVPIFQHKEIMMYDITKRFSGSDIIEEYSQNDFLHIGKLVCGSGSAGNSNVNKDYKLYGSKYNGIYNFKKRMLNRYGLLEDLNINDKLNIIIVDNKRYSEYERKVLNDVVTHFSNVYNIKYINWQSYSSFEEQLKEISNVDIQITGPGTGMLYIPFLKKNSVNINLGYMEEIPGRANTTIQSLNKKVLVPSWMEQSVCEGCEQVHTIYYDRYEFNNIEFIPMLDIINKAVSIINGDIKIDTNLNTDALIFKEYCNRVDNYKELCNHLLKISFWIDAHNFVNEHPNAVPKDIVNIELLREIKKEFNYGDKYLINKYL